ncbi:MAG: hypothetical protein JSS88_07300 [Actinobacteria bacterium]|nr:hypothetical protein [Actinomycetota bacterium]
MAATAALPVDPLDDLFPDPDGIISSLVADMPAPAPESAARVSALLWSAR